MNNSLYGNNIDIPMDIKNVLKSALSKHSATSNNNQEGITRNRGMINKNTITYQQLKRIKNWFDTYSGPKDSKEYELNGGDKVKNWVDSVLKQMRDGDKSHKQIQKDYYPETQNKTDHEINLSSDNRPSQSHGNVLAKYNIDVTESLQRINEIMSKL